MLSQKTHRIIIAETAPVILRGLVESIRIIQDVNTGILEVDTKDSLIDTISSQMVDLLILNPTFGGLIHPDEIRKASLNNELKIFAIEISKLNKATLSLYDNHLHVTDDINEISRKIKSTVFKGNKNNDEKENLSLREKEIISYVVKGYTNQDIANKLFISVHTVMTHRRNIARKLQIHSATGLTIYAIVNKIVHLSEIRL